MGCGNGKAAAPQPAAKPALENTLLDESAVKEDPSAPKKPRASLKGEEVMMNANATVKGEEVVNRLTGQKGTVLKRTTTDLLLQNPDGTEAWVAVEDIGQPAMLAAAYNASKGEAVAVLSMGNAQGSVLQRTTTDVLLRMEDGTEAWYAVEDVAQVLPTAYDVKKGDEVVQLSDGAKGIVQERSTTDVLLRMADGTDKWHGLEDVARASVAGSVPPAAVAEVPPASDMAKSMAPAEPEGQKEQAVETELVGKKVEPVQNEAVEIEVARKEGKYCCF